LDKQSTTLFTYIIFLCPYLLSYKRTKCYGKSSFFLYHNISHSLIIIPFFQNPCFVCSHYLRFDI